MGVNVGSITSSMMMMALSKAKKQAMHFTTESLMQDFVHLYHFLEEYGDFIPPKFILAGLKGLDNAASGPDASDKVYSVSHLIPVHFFAG
jgi:hypothetical protein